MKKHITFFVPIFLFSIFLISIITPLLVMSENIDEKVIRLHVLANSDSEKDQKLKLKVRDEILKYSNSEFSDLTSFDEAKNTISKSLKNIEKIANETIKKNGYDYKVKVSLTKEFYETREYSTFTLPAGVYDSLKVVIGSGKGHNWWCVMYPSVCLSGCIDEFDKELTKNEKTFVTSKKYKIKFKVVEVYEKIKYMLS